MGQAKAVTPSNTSKGLVPVTVRRLREEKGDDPQGEKKVGGIAQVQQR